MHRVTPFALWESLFRKFWSHNDIQFLTVKDPRTRISYIVHCSGRSQRNSCRNQTQNGCGLYRSHTGNIVTFSGVFFFGRLQPNDMAAIEVISKLFLFVLHKRAVHKRSHTGDIKTLFCSSQQNMLQDLQLSEFRI